ncbi:hypothetical protein GCM10029976_078400 [Kribbella albertanoniae]
MQNPSMGIQIRAATPDLLAAAVRKFMGAEPGRTYLDSPGTLAFVAADPEVLGWCWGYHLPRPDGTSMLYLHQFAVDENHRRRGIGKGLLRAFMTAGTEPAPPKCSSPPAPTTTPPAPCTTPSAAASPSKAPPSTTGSFSTAERLSLVGSSDAWICCVAA